MKKIMLISSVILTIIVMSIITINNIDKNEKNIIKNKEEKEIIKSNMLTLMYETEAGSKEYEESKDNTWPEEGYIFNKTLSGCENGGELEYNSQNNTVNLLTNKSDKCYVYFDKYNGVWIDNVVATNITGSSITIDISATSENGSISKYYYRINESEYIESSNKEITISDLNKLTEYKIEVYAVDNTNAKSNIYELNVSTTDISIPIINNVSVSNITTTGFTLTVNATSEYEISKYYFIIDSEDIAGITSENNYTFYNLNYNTTYKVKIYVVDNEDNISKIYTINITTEDVLFLADYIKGLYTSQGANGLYYHTSSLANGAEDNSYRYAGANPNNYVCFGSDASPCPDDNLYRIIGVFDDEVKLIKWDYANRNILGTNGSFSNTPINITSNYRGNLTKIDVFLWNNNTATNNWNESNLNTINLNQNFINNIGILWSNLISTHSWKVGGMTADNGLNSNAKNVYDYEVGVYSFNINYSAKIGLMYYSDYYFSASPNFWLYPGVDSSTNKDYSAAVNNNWMYMGFSDWTITRWSETTNYVLDFTSEGRPWDPGKADGRLDGVRPCFYLLSTVKYIKGSGTQSDPIRIS